jgi:hypothetical protein
MVISHQQSFVWFVNISTILPTQSPSRNIVKMPTSGSIAGLVAPMSLSNLAKEYAVTIVLPST